MRWWATTSAASPTPDYLPAAAAAGAAVVATHIRLAPRVRDPEPHYDDVVEAVRDFLVDRARAGARRPACRRDRIILDAGLDLGKTAEQSLALLRGVGRRWPAWVIPLLLSASNKTFLGVVLDLDDRPTGARRRWPPRPSGSALGCRVLRVHDVAGTRRARRARRRVERPRRAPDGWTGGVTRGARGDRPPAPGRVGQRPAATGTGRGPGGGSGPKGDAPAYLVRGDDASLVAQAVRSLLERLVGERDPALVVEEHGGPSADELEVGAVIDACHDRPVPHRSPGGGGPRRRAPVGGATPAASSPAWRTRSPSTVLVLAGGGGTVPPSPGEGDRGGGRRDRHGGRHRSDADGTGWPSTSATPRSGSIRRRRPWWPSTSATTWAGWQGILGRWPRSTARVPPSGWTSSSPSWARPGAVPPWDLTDAIDSGATAAALGALQRMTEAGGGPRPRSSPSSTGTSRPCCASTAPG